MKKEYTGLNIQWPISELIVTGEKIVETRTYAIPEKYIGTEMLLIETPGRTGKFKSRIIAIIKFTECFKYKNKKTFHLDKERHCVEKGSIWDWKDKPKFGWKVEVIKKFKQPILFTKQKGIVFTKNISI